MQIYLFVFTIIDTFVIIYLYYLTIFYAQN
jgi:hypothetical protein